MESARIASALHSCAAVRALVAVVILLSAGAALHANPLLLRVGADEDYPPYSFLDRNGHAQGFDIEVARLLSRRLGLQIAITLEPWGRVLADLEAGRLDVAIGALFTLTRSERFAFSVPYNTDTISIFTKRGTSIRSINDLQNRTMASLQGDAIPETFLATNGLHARISLFPTFSGALESVSRGESDYCLAPYAVGIEAANRSGINGLTVTGPPVMTIQYRLAAALSRQGLMSQLDRELSRLPGDPEFEAIRSEWLHHTRRELSTEMLFRYTALVLVPAILLMLAVWVITLKRQVRRQTAAMERMATHDSLTGIPNRRLFDTLASEEFGRSKRRDAAMSILFLDLDHFKSINDTYGHAAGDGVLSQFAVLCREELRDYDTLARYGGEEFVVLLRDTVLEEAALIAERVRKGCSLRQFDAGGGRVIRCTVSIGVAALSVEDESCLEVIRRADAALYQAKGRGRDSVAHCRSGAADGLPVDSFDDRDKL
ncbi:diguanylate cyclase [Salinispira pacifica]